MTIDTAADNIAKVQGELATIDRIEAGFAALAKEHPADVVIDVTTAKGMKEAVAARAAWRDPRIAVEKARKAAKAPVLELGRAIDARAAALTLRLEAGEANYDGQIKAEEARKEAERQRLAAAEAERVARIQDYLEAIRECETDVVRICKTAAETQAMIEHTVTVKGVNLERFQEFRPQAEELLAKVLQHIREIHTERVAAEAEAARVASERAELARLRAEQEARDKAERERVAAEQAAERERLAAERAEMERQQAAARAEQQRIDAEAAAARRAADEKAAAERAEADLLAREQRDAEDRAARAAHAAEQKRIDAEAAELRRQQDEAAEARRKQVEADELAKWQAQREAAAAQKRLADAAPQMLAALTLVRDDPHASSLDSDTWDAVSRSLEAAGELADVPY